MNRRENIWSNPYAQKDKVVTKAAFELHGFILFFLLFCNGIEKHNFGFNVIYACDCKVHCWPPQMQQQERQEKSQQNLFWRFLWFYVKGTPSNRRLADRPLCCKRRRMVRADTE
ncbi:hypothetical protein TNCV_1348851 [Trichonephila clavipes]|nr:hypothetical protein TNCV_1348851 [Trichonephila clavipes]